MSWTRARKRDTHIIITLNNLKAQYRFTTGTTHVHILCVMTSASEREWLNRVRVMCVSTEDVCSSSCMYICVHTGLSQTNSAHKKNVTSSSIQQKEKKKYNKFKLKFSLAYLFLDKAFFSFQFFFSSLHSLVNNLGEKNVNIFGKQTRVYREERKIYELTLILSLFRLRFELVCFKGFVFLMFLIKTHFVL